MEETVFPLRGMTLTTLELLQLIFVHECGTVDGEDVHFTRWCPVMMMTLTDAGSFRNVMIVFVSTS